MHSILIYMKRHTLVVVIVMILVFVGVVGYGLWARRSEPVTQQQISNPTETENFIQRTDSGFPYSSIPSISVSQKTIVADGKVLLSVDDEMIFNFFKDKNTGVCDISNINNTPTRKSFCTDREVFKSRTHFSAINASPDGKKISFTIEMDELTPDTVVGMFYPFNTTYKVHFLTNFYLGNQFISFSPSSKNFVYKSSCFEGICGFFVKDSNTLANKISFPDQDIESRSSYTFIRWISDSEIEYKVGNELKQLSF